MIRPPRGRCWRITRNASRVHRKAPVRLTATTAFHSRSGTVSSSRAGAPVPALLNSRSTRPWRSTDRSNNARTDASSVTSVGAGSSTPGSSAPRSAAEARAWGRRPASTTTQPWPARACATAAPMPLPAPVTTATLGGWLAIVPPPPRQLPTTGEHRPDQHPRGEGAMDVPPLPPLPPDRWPDAPGRYPDPAVRVLDPRFDRYRLHNAAVERIATGYRWVEGPVWFGDHHCLVWSDIPNNRMLRWDEATGAVTVFRSPSNHANGHTRDRQGRLVSCEHLTRRVTRTEHDGPITVLIDRFGGRPLNAPHDVVVASDGP